ncbi:hypothetical protein PHMEG_00032835 [Phytophthora megakarya]|uniref:EGF-like domain-containing protein n=1 Tax=Phytophthora megakarya TaxID=4795 RepID=A0A225UUH3_9STRA|nr:hypothetical protein PHMEG_00032835 [Phytophthora megakarya]
MILKRRMSTANCILGDRCCVCELVLGSPVDVAPPSTLRSELTVNGFSYSVRLGSGARVSKRKCPTGVAWTDKAKTTNVAHALAECSNRGLCDYSKEQPANDSSATLALQYGPDSLPGVGGDGVGPIYSNWEKDSMSNCMCDMGYTGPDCSQLMCAKNDDPLTTGQGYRTIQIAVGATATALAGSIRIHFLGDVATFSADAAADAAHEAACTSAFQSMRSVLTATCTITSVDPVTKGAIYTVVFKEWVHLGAENNLLYHSGNPSLSSFTCDISKVTSLNTPTCAITDVTATNVVEHVYCSNRGLCDFTTGHCLCYADFKGLDCNQPSNVPDSIDDNDGFIINPLGLTYIGTVLHLKTAKGSQADFYFIKIESATLPILTMNGVGDTKLLNGNLWVSTGSLTITTMSQTSTAADIANTHNTFTGTALKIRTSRVSGTAFKLLEGSDDWRYNNRRRNPWRRSNYYLHGWFSCCDRRRSHFTHFEWTQSHSHQFVCHFQQFAPQVSYFTS